MGKFIDQRFIEGFNDPIINYPYDLIEVNAKELSDYIKARLKKKGINYNEFNPDFDIEKRASWGMEDIKETIVNPPREIYEYLNFVLYYDNDSQEYYLLDGFRRLLWYNTPNIPIRVRVYHKLSNDEKTVLSDKQILSLLLYLNHFKFFVGDNYMERGFTLLLHAVFNLTIQQYKSAFDSYLWSNKIKNDYSSDHINPDKQNLVVKERILNDFFLSDIKFLEECTKAGCMVNSFFGAYVYQERLKSDKEFSSKQFINLSKENKVLQDLMDRYHKMGSSNDERKRKCVNQIMEMYQNIFKIMSGKKTEKSYAENLKDCKDMSAQLKKDKNWIKMTGKSDYYRLDNYIKELVGKGIELQFKCIVYPETYNRNLKLPHGLTEELKILRIQKSARWGHTDNIVIGLNNDNCEWLVSHNYGDNAKHYTTITNLNIIPQSSYNIDLFVNIPQKDYENCLNT